MGTSTNQRSPGRPTWKLPQAVIGRNDVQSEAQSAEIWRAAAFDPETDVRRRLADPVIASACSLAGSASNPAEAISRYNGLLNESRVAGLFFDLARRALVRAVAQNSGSEGFGREVFAEAVGYYASRDLPSFVGKNGRIASATEIIALKNELQHHARMAASSEKVGKVTEERWNRFVANVVGKLARKKVAR